MARNRTQFGPRAMTARQFQWAEQHLDEREPWRLRDDEESRDFYEEHLRLPWDSGLEVQAYFPEERMLPEEGAWVTVLRPPNTEIVLDFGETYFATPWRDTPHGWQGLRYSVGISTKSGDVRLWPYEYAVLDPAELAAAVSVGDMRFEVFDENAAGLYGERVFYLQSRGLPLGEALPLAIGDVLAPVGRFVLAERTVHDAG